MADFFVSPLRRQSEDTSPSFFSQPTEPLAPEERVGRTPESSSFVRGAESALRSATIGRNAELANQAEQAGDVHKVSALRTENERLRGEQVSGAPRVASMGEIKNIGDAWDYAAQTAGGLAVIAPPVIAGGAAAGLLAPEALVGAGGVALAQALGAGGAMYKQSKQAAHAEHELDPEIMARSPEEREASAQRAGALSAVAGAIPIARGMSGLAAPASRAARMALGAGEGAAGGMGMAAAQTAGLQELNPQRDTSHDAESLAENALIGGVLGAAGGIHTPKERVEIDTNPKKRALTVVEAARGAGKTAKNFKEWMGRVFSNETGDEIKTEHLIQGDAHPDNMGATAAETEINLMGSDKRRAADAAEFAESLLNNPNTSQGVKDQIKGYAGNYDDHAAQNYIGHAMKYQQAGEKAGIAIRDLISKIKGILPKKGTEIPEEGTKQSAMLSSGYLAAEDAVVGGLKPELQSNPAALKQARELARLIADLTVRGNDVTDSALRTFGGFSSLDSLFAEPAAVLDAVGKAVGVDSLAGRFKSHSTAQEDAKAQGGRLYQALPPDRKESITTAELRGLAQFVDHVASGGAVKGDALEVLTQVYGSREAAEHVLDYYERRAKDAGVYEKEEAEPAAGDEANQEPRTDKAETGMTEQAEPSTFAFETTASGGRRPFHESELDLARKAAIAQRAPGQHARLINMAEVAKREGRAPVEVLGEIRKDTENRIEQHQRRVAAEPQRQEQINRLNSHLKDIEDTQRSVHNDPMLKGLPDDVMADYAAQKALSKFKVGELLGETNKELADDNFIKASKAGLKARNRDPAEAVTFIKTDGSELTLHAPSMVRAMGERQGPGKGESASERASRLFKDAVSSVLGREDITGIKTRVEDVKVTANQTLGEIDRPKYRGVTEPENAVPRTELERDNPPVRGGDKFDALRDFAEQDAKNPRLVKESIDEAKAQIATKREQARHAVNTVKQALERKTDGKPYNRAALEAVGDTDAWLARQEKIDSFRRGELDKYDELGTDLRQIEKDQKGGMASTEEIGQGVGPRSVTEGQEPLRRAQAKGEMANIGANAPERPIEVRRGIMKEKQEQQRVRREAEAGADLQATRFNERLDQSVGQKSLVDRFTEFTEAVTEKLNEQVAENDRNSALKNLESMVGGVADVLKDTLESLGVHGVGGMAGSMTKGDISRGFVALASSKLFLLNKLNARDVANHEAAHVLVGATHALHGKETAKAIVNLVNKKAIKDQVIAFAEKQGLDPSYYIHNPEEMFAEAFALWMKGGLKLGVDPNAKLIQRVFQHIKEFITKLTGDQSLDQIFKGLKAGELKKTGVTPEEIAQATLSRNYDPEFYMYQTMLDAKQLADMKSRTNPAYHGILDYAAGAVNKANIAISGKDLMTILSDFRKMMLKGGYAEKDWPERVAKTSVRLAISGGDFIDKPAGDRSLGAGAAKEIDKNAGTTQVGDKTDEEIRKQTTADPTGVRMSAEQAAKIREDITRMRGPEGPKLKIILDKFAADIGASGDWAMKNGERIIRVAMDAAMPLSVAYHEAVHDFYETLLSDPKTRQFKQSMVDAASSGPVLSQLRKLLANEPKALEQLKDPAERLAYMHQFWASGDLRVGPQTRTLLGKVFKMIREVLGVVSQSERAEQIMRALHEGKLTDPNLVAARISDMKVETLAAKARELSGPIGEAMNKFATSATDRLRNTGIEAYAKIADTFHKEAGRETGRLGMLQERTKQDSLRMNEFQNIMAGATKVEVREILERAQKMEAPLTDRDNKLAAFFKGLRDYMVEAGVKNIDEKGNETEMGNIGGYRLPRVFDREYIRNNEAAFRELFGKHMSTEQVEAMFKAFTSGNGAMDLAETPHHLGFTPWNASIKNRQLTFIDSSNAAEFAKFQVKSLEDIVGTYIKQATHRAEYARVWGNKGERLAELQKLGVKQGATAEEQAMMAKAVQALEGTLGYDMNPRLRGLFSGLQQYQNVVLLPFALASSVVDIAGIALRSGDMKEAFRAFKTGVAGIYKSMAGTYKDGDFELARIMGMISDGSLMDALGSAYESQYGVKWLRKMNNAMFRYNGMERWNQSMRIAAMNAGMRFLVRNVSDPGPHSARWLQELGVERGDVRELPNGKIATSVADGLTPEQEKRIQSGLYSFVDSAVVRPNSAHRPIWGSDPHWSLVFHLKQFTYSMQSVILKRVRHEFENGNTHAAYVLASYVPIMIAADLVKAGLTGHVHADWGLLDYIGHGIQRSGIMGVGTFGADALADTGMGNIPGASLLGPTGGHAISMAQTISGHKSMGDLLWRSTPAGALIKATPIAD